LNCYQNFFAFGIKGGALSVRNQKSIQHSGR
jgi:hypothetical protein